MISVTCPFCAIQGHSIVFGSPECPHTSAGSNNPPKKGFRRITYIPNMLCNDCGCVMLPKGEVEGTVGLCRYMGCGTCNYHVIVRVSIADIEELV